MTAHMPNGQGSPPAQRGGFNGLSPHDSRRRFRNGGPTSRRRERQGTILLGTFMQGEQVVNAATCMLLRKRIKPLWQQAVVQDELHRRQPGHVKGVKDASFNAGP